MRGLYGVWVLGSSAIAMCRLPNFDGVRENAEIGDFCCFSEYRPVTPKFGRRHTTFTLVSSTHEPYILRTVNWADVTRLEARGART